MPDPRGLQLDRSNSLVEALRLVGWGVWHLVRFRSHVTTYYNLLSLGRSQGSARRTNIWHERLIWLRNVSHAFEAHMAVCGGREDRPRTYLQGLTVRTRWGSTICEVEWWIVIIVWRSVVQGSAPRPGSLSEAQFSQVLCTWTQTGTLWLHDAEWGPHATQWAHGKNVFEKATVAAGLTKNEVSAKKQDACSQRPKSFLRMFPSLRRRRS